MSAGLSDGELGERLAARTLELVDIPSESRDEAVIAAPVSYTHLTLPTTPYV